MFAAPVADWSGSLRELLCFQQQVGWGTWPDEMGSFPALAGFALGTRSVAV